ncbi:protein-glutamine gamma-glutamyltransferase 4 [Carlito syrichta]|uniref:Protein-glutamine gamma-glutamyltransferase 4 n=1 Tax=Carlito syrichta TaxID=1868482 RepID=A0A1U7UUL4_CARSF|nr:protein-glutamine gamma-glutamyltransferase 4 [Carlito syrichta]
MATLKDLQVLRIDFMKQKNAASHHTSEFQTSIPVFRRGQVFYLRLFLNQPLQPFHNLNLQFSTGPNPNISKHTLVVVNPRVPLSSHRWQASLQDQSNAEVTVAVTSVPHAIVGKYYLQVKTGSNTFQPEEDALYLLFNPWCKEDMVFMPSEEELAEYILNDTGCHFVGVAQYIRQKPWNFGQFEKDILDCCILLLDESSLKPIEKRDPVLVCRAMSALVNFENGKGVLVGNWSGKYEGGTAPYLWTGSVPILQQYYTTMQPVCFGQCWVFSGILTTVLRALGIPARSVTAFDSAHDTERNLTVDAYVDEKGKTITDMTYDSIWNFHVWTEAWMKRRDLPKGYDGWQVVDGTPQERSEGAYCCGPSPLAAIRKGDIFMVYDTKFIFSEVNGDKLIWMVKSVNEQQELHVVSKETMGIGKNISTKAVGQDSRNDITSEYKYPEGSSEEREIMEHAFSLLSFEKEYVSPIRDNFLQMIVQADHVLFGNAVNFTVTLKRKTAIPQDVNISGSFDLQMYTGKRVANLCILNKTVMLEEEVSEVTLTLDPKSYIDRLIMLDDDPIIRGFIISEIVESGEIIASEVFTCFQYPKFSVQLPNTAKVDQVLVCTCIFKNSMAIPLTNVKFSLESLGVVPLQISNQGTVKAGETIQSQIKCTPVKTGPRKFIVKLSSDQVKEIHAQKLILITK